MLATKAAGVAGSAIGPRPYEQAGDVHLQPVIGTITLTGAEVESATSFIGRSGSGRPYCVASRRRTVG